MNVVIAQNSNRAIPIAFGGYPDFTTLLAEYARDFGSSRALSISRMGHEQSFDYQALWARARAAADAISSRTKAGDRVLLPMPTSSAFVEAFFGCMLAGRIAVPLPVEKKGSRYARVANVAADCRPALALFRTHLDMRQMMEGIGEIPSIAIEDDGWPEAEPIAIATASAATAAFIQYTSGSTSTPKGVVITHGNILSNTSMICGGMALSEEDRVVSWLPIHHDLGLMGMLLAPIAARAQPHLYPPEEFAKDPAGWMVETSRRRGTLTGAPNFAFDLIARKARLDALEGLDLSSVRLMYCGSERIAEETIRAFFHRLKPFGLGSGTFFTCYGMAEASVYVTGGFKDGSGALAPAGSAHPIYPSCGRAADGLDVRFARDDGSPSTEPGVVGEIEISGASVSPGYWHEVADRMKGALAPADSRDGHLRTGDLGFLWNGEVVVTGRLKDIIKVRGRNIYPEDLELPLETEAADMLPANGVVVASTMAPDGNRELLTVVAEIDRKHRRGPFDDLLSRFQAVLAGHDVRCERMIVVGPLGLPKTSSGKKQRRRTAHLIEKGDIAVLWDSLPPERPSSTAAEDGDVRRVDLDRVRSHFDNIDAVLADERRTFPPDLLKVLHESGLLSMLIPQKHGGCGVSHAAFARIGEELGRIDVSLAAIVGIQNTIGLLPIIWSETLPDRDAILGSVAGRGEAVAFALTEPASSGSNPRDVVSRIVRRDGRMFLSGEKIWIGNATFASFIDVFAQEYDEAGDAIGVSAFLLRSGRHDYRVGSEQLTLGVRAMPQARLTFDEVELCEVDRLSAPGQGLALAYRAMEYARFGLAAVALGASHSAFALAWSHAASRRIAGGMLSANGHFQVAMGESLIDAESLRAIVASSAGTLDAGGELPQVLSLSCKILAGEIGFSGVDRALQFTGGRGYTETFGLARIWRDVRVLRIFEGPTEAVAAHLGALAARRPEIIRSAFGDDAGERHSKAALEAERLVGTAASIYGRTTNQDAFHVELGVFTARAIGLATLLGSLPNDEVRQAAEARMRILANALERRMGELDGLTAAFGILSSSLQNAPLREARSSGLFDAWHGRAHAIARVVQIADRAAATSIPPAVAKAPPSVADTRSGDTSSIANALATWIGRVTKRVAVDPDKPIAVYGIDSLLAFELHCFVLEEYNVQLPDSAFAEDLSARQLAARIDVELQR